MFHCIEVSPEDMFYCIEVSPEDRFYCIEPLGGGDIEMLGVCVRACVRLSVRHKACDNLRFHSPIYSIFDPVMHATIALDEFEDE